MQRGRRSPFLQCKVIELEKITRKRISSVSLLVFIIYIIILSYFVYFSDRYGRTDRFLEYRYNLTPFREINRYFNYKEYFTLENLFTNLIGNVFIFFPVGILVPIFKERKVGILYIGGASFLFSLSIETIQLVFRIGVFDVDDLIMNTAGGILGFILYTICREIYRFQLRMKIRKKKAGETDADKK